MKKILLALFIASATLLSFSSCTKEYIENHYEEARTYTFHYTISPNHWNGQGTNLLHTALEVPELTDDYVDYGVINLSISFDNKQTYTKLPATVDGISYNYDYTTRRVDLFAQDPIIENVAIDINQTLHLKVSLTEGR